MPLLSIYLALAVGGLCLLSRVQRWMWLGVSAIAGGLGWGAVLLLGGALDPASSISIGIYVLLVGIALPLLALPGAAGGLLRIGGSIVAAAQIAALVATGGFALLHWGLFGTISIAIVWLARREDEFGRVPVVGLGIALLLAGAWPEPEPAHFALVLVAAACIYGIPALLTLWRPRGSLVEAGEIAALSLGVTILSAFHYYRADHSMDLALAAIAIAAAVLPAVAAMLGWRDERRGEDARFALLCSTVALQLGLAAGFAAPTVTLPLIVAAIGLAMLLLSRRSGDIRLEHSAWLFAAAALPLLAAAPMAEAETLRLAGKTAPVDQAVAVLRWGILALLAALFAWRARLEVGRGAAQVAAALLAYGAAAQLVPGDWLALVPPLGLLGLSLAGRSVGFGRLIPAMAVPLTLAFLWAGAPLFAWVDSAVPSIGGVPVLVSDLPALRETLLRLLAPALLILAALAAADDRVARNARIAAGALGAVLAAVATHILFKQLFSIASNEAFVAAGLAERTLWQGLLMAAALAAWKLRYRRAALGLSVASLAHFGWYSLLLHNPLWAEQAVGRLPFLSLLLPAYGLPLAWLWLVGRLEPKLAERTGRAREIMQMLLITLLAFSMLRQLAEGSLLAGPGLAPAEDIARSILAAALAIAFLLWGIATGSRDRRIFSLVLMLGAVAKVFLLDASGLEGLMRIASFVALGLSLIGIGWLYSRSFAGERPLTGLR